MKQTSSWNRLGPILLAAYVAVLVWTLPDFGVTWDEPRFFQVGDRHLAYFTTFDDEYLAIPEGHEGWGYYGPLAATVSSAAARVFHGALGWLEEDAARHLGNVLFAGLAGASLWALIRVRDGARPAFFGLLVFAVLPRWFGHAHSNISDLPAAACFLAGLACLATWGRRGGKAPLAGLALAMGATAAVRPQTAVFLPVVAAAWVLADADLRRRVRARPLVIATVAAGALLTLVACWPMFWFAPVSSARNVTAYFLNPPEGWYVYPLFYLGRRIEDGAPWHYPWVMTVVTTPVTVLALALLGAAASLLSRGSERRGSAILASIWLVVTIGNHSFLRGNYDGVRHFLEAFGALAWLAGLGADRAVGWVSTALARSRAGPRLGAAVGTALVVVSLAPACWAIARLHPYPQLFYHGLVTDLADAERSFETDYWGFTVKDGVAWLNANAAPGAVVAVPWGEELFRHYAREDLEIVRTPTPQTVRRTAVAARRSGGREVYYAFHVRRGFVSPKGGVTWARRSLTRAFAIERDGAALFEVYRADGGGPGEAR